MLTEKLEIDIIDIEVGRKMCYTKDETKLARWCMVLSAKSIEEFKKAMEGLMDKETKKEFEEEVEKYSRDDRVYALYSAYTREELERNTFIEEARIEGTKQGRKENSFEIARNLKNMGLSASDIMKATSLTKTEIDKI